MGAQRRPGEPVRRAALRPGRRLRVAPGRDCQSRLQRGGAALPPARNRAWPLGGARDSREPRPQPPAEWPERAMELEPEVLLQEARENVEAAQSYRRELGQRLQRLREARRQVGGPLPEGRCGPRGGHGVPSGWTRARSAPSGESV